MQYTIVDLLDKLIIIEKNGYEMFMKMASDTDVHEKIKVLARVFASEEKRHMEVYRNIKEKVQHASNLEIDFGIYDKAAKLIYEFSRYNRITKIENTKEMLEFCLNFEKENLALVLSIQGILVNTQEDTETREYKTLTEIIKEEEKHVANIVAFLK